MAEAKCNSSDSEIVQEDKLSKRIGEFGKWHILVFMFAVAPVKYTSYNMSLGIVFLAPKTTFRCSTTNLTTHIQNDTCYSDCEKYEYYSQFENTIISEWGLICGKEWLADLTQTTNMCGVLIGSIIFGFLADRFGRRPAMLTACMLQLCTSFTTALVTDFWVFTVTRFVLGVSTAGNMLGSYVLLMELCGPGCRELVTCVYHIPFPIAEITAPVFAYYLTSWNTFSIGIAVPTLIYLSYFFILPESPKWLISTRRLEEASLVMTKAAKMNQLNTEDMLQTVMLMAQEANVSKEKLEVNKLTYIDLVRYPILRIRIICCCIMWFLIGACFYGCSQYLGQTSTNIYITISLAGVLMIPSFLLCAYLIKKFGRRFPTMGFCLLAAACSGLVMLDTGYTAQLVIGVMGLVSITCAFTTLYTFTSELFPTVARNMAMGASSTTSRVGSALAPFVVGLKTEATWLPPTVFAVLPLLAVAACVCLPETKGKKVADTLDNLDK